MKLFTWWTIRAKKICYRVKFCLNISSENVKIYTLLCQENSSVWVKIGKCLRVCYWIIIAVRFLAFYMFGTCLSN